jgi:hypothetical protein
MRYFTLFIVLLIKHHLQNSYRTTHDLPISCFFQCLSLWRTEERFRDYVYAGLRRDHQLHKNSFVIHMKKEEEIKVFC